MNGVKLLSRWKNIEQNECRQIQRQMALICLESQAIERFSVSGFARLVPFRTVRAL